MIPIGVIPSVRAMGANRDGRPRFAAGSVGAGRGVAVYARAAREGWPVVTECCALARGRVLGPERRAFEKVYPVARYLVVRVARRRRRDGSWFMGGFSVSGGLGG